ncbi:Crp/Fnr family transcriptional regulator [Flavitalea sp. BT771]|uniref:Crp/Fnr family transcriptional regulator n=1 Tax=Flavitalea sp. BT771 TaxID=3063329 RepID=UPI0026E2DCE9|nr:Crp/Fnr family transcriptional regulator [Flavitalea sp. BT771]MDO6429631.1 Crp/Fnr family transcriptional regulator [Flavitalea sp. BT771]MDV6218241.1 Crp/Fnr family transcriptional regulator [Flavitalea sp. BT771]
MYDTFQEYLDRKIQLNNDEKELIRSVSILKKLRKKQYLLQEGDVWKYHAFITRGCMRTYAVDDKGVEHIIYFGIENWWIGDRESLLSQTPSRLNIDAIEDSEVILFTDPNFEMICSKVPAFRDMVHTIISKSLNVNQNRVLSSISKTAEEKYLEFIQKYADFAVRIPQAMIASYLGIKPETLSRIRNAIARR